MGRKSVIISYLLRLNFFAYGEEFSHNHLLGLTSLHMGRNSVITTHLLRLNFFAYAHGEELSYIRLCPNFSFISPQGGNVGHLQFLSAPSPAFQSALAHVKVHLDRRLQRETPPTRPDTDVLCTETLSRKYCLCSKWLHAWFDCILTRRPDQWVIMQFMHFHLLFI